MFKFEARIARNSQLLRRFAPTVGALGDEEVGHFGLNIFIHELIRGSLSLPVHFHKHIAVSVAFFGGHSTHHNLKKIV